MDITNTPEPIRLALARYYSGWATPHLLWAGRPTVEVAVRLAEGVAPADIHVSPGDGHAPVRLGSVLTRRESAAYCSQDAQPSPAQWLWSQHRWPAAPEKLDTHSLAVIRWLSRLDDEQRECMSTHNYWVRLDEVTEEVIRDGVHATFDAAEDAAVLNEWSGPDELIAAQDWEEGLPAGVEHIRSFRRLRQEGREQHHCVSSYADRIVKRQSVILSLMAEDGTRSTVDIVGWRVQQHRAKANTDPSPACRALAEQALAHIAKVRSSK